MTGESIDRRNWHWFANCKPHDFHLFFNDKNRKIDTVKYRKAVELCSSCVVKEHCLADSFLYADEYGIRGGLSEYDRQKIGIKKRQALISWLLSLRC